MMTSRRILALLLTLSIPVVACQAEDADDGADTAEGASSNKTGPETGGTRPGIKDQALDVDLVLKGWNKVKDDFYRGSQPGFGTGPGKRPKKLTAKNVTDAGEFEPATCINACPDFWSDIVCHYYCWHPSYEELPNNTRGCYTNVGRGTPLQTEARPNRRMHYPEIYEYCLYQPFDPIKVQQGKAPPVYDSKEIKANKAAGKKVGVLKWVDDNEAASFKHVMFTWYGPRTFSIESQQEAINKFYGVDLKGNLDYTAKDKAQVAECREKRPVRKGAAPDPTDGTHCSTKTNLKRFQNHSEYQEVVDYLNGK